jgi:hypothetical protein
LHIAHGDNQLANLILAGRRQRTTQITAGNAAGSFYRVIQPAGNAPRHNQR